MQKELSQNEINERIETIKQTVHDFDNALYELKVKQKNKLAVFVNDFKKRKGLN